MPTLREIVDQQVREGNLYEKARPQTRVRCYACGHCCPIPEGHARRLQSPFTIAVGSSTSPGGTWAACSAIPSRRSPSSTPILARWAYSFGMLGCDPPIAPTVRNWVTSQALRDPNAISPPLEASSGGPRPGRRLRQGARVLVSTYNVAAHHCGMGRGDSQRSEGLPV